MKIAMISDCHEQWHNLVIPRCDLLISAGDYTYRGDPDKVYEYHKWLSRQPAKHIISLQGNHELWVEKNFKEAQEIVKAIDERIYFVAVGAKIIENTYIYCSAVTPEFHNWAWNVERGAKIKAHWDLIPDNTQILITHGPAYGMLDQMISGKQERTYSLFEHSPYDHLGCPELRDKIKTLSKLKLHVFGHIHGGSGECDLDGVHYVNAAICNERYKPVNPVRIWEI